MYMYTYICQSTNSSKTSRDSRNQEVAGFCIQLVQLGVGLVVGNGFTCAHDGVNMIDLGVDSDPYLDFTLPSMAKLVAEGYGNGVSYRKGACR